MIMNVEELKNKITLGDSLDILSGGGLGSRFLFGFGNDGYCVS